MIFNNLRSLVLVSEMMKLSATVLEVMRNSILNEEKTTVSGLSNNHIDVGEFIKAMNTKNY